MVSVADDRSTEPVAAPPVGEGYRPHLDGLRAVAVYLVVLYHAGVDRFSGGFIGVDVFFVLSGYLVTQLLMRDLLSQGRIRIARFYARRMRRLFPASFVALVVTGVVYSAIASPAEVSSAVNAFKAAFLYSANWFFIRRSADYFAADINTNPVIHFWSLAVEEQFYFVWPILLTAIFAMTRRLRSNAHRATQLVVGLAALASLLWALRLAGENLNRAYYGTDARAYQLLAGAFLALSPGLIRRAGRWRASVVAAAPLALVVLVGLSTSRFHASAIHRGIGATVATVVLIVAIESAPGGPVNRLLSSGPAVYLGQISYGTYLWHWPVIVAALSLNKQITPLSTFAIGAFVATGLASLSFHLIERPIRQERLLDRINPVVIGAGLGLAVLTALVVMPHVLDSDRSPTATVQAATNARFTPIPKLNFAAVRTFPKAVQGERIPKSDNCEGRPVAACTILKGSGEHILLIGDSHAEMFLPTFIEIAKTEHLTLSVAASAGCPWQQHFYRADVAFANTPQLRAACITFKRDLYQRVVPQLKPDLVVAISSDSLTVRPGVEYDDNDKPLASENSANLPGLVKSDTEASAALLLHSANKVLIVEPVPITESADDPFACLTKSKWLEDCRFVASLQPTPLQLIDRGMADRRHVYEANFDKLVCPFMPICDPVIGGNIVRFDNQHLAPAFAVTLAGDVTTFLQEDGLLRR